MLRQQAGSSSRGAEKGCRSSTPDRTYDVCATTTPLRSQQLTPPPSHTHTRTPRPRTHPPHRRRAGYPFGTLVDFASDGGGLPIFCLSPLAIHARNLIEDPRCSLVVQMPGWTGLANARVTIFGDTYQLPPDMQVGSRVERGQGVGGVGSGLKREPPARNPPLGVCVDLPADKCARTQTTNTNTIMLPR